MRKLIIILFAIAMSSCGDEPKGKRTNPTPPAPKPPAAGKGWSSVLPIVKEQCALSGCHAGAAFLASGEAMKASSAAARIKNGSMPKASSPNIGKFSDEKKDKLLDFLGG